jgi:hypothetical protein
LIRREIAKERAGINALKKQSDASWKIRNEVIEQLRKLDHLNVDNKIKAQNAGIYKGSFKIDPVFDAARAQKDEQGAIWRLKESGKIDEASALDEQIKKTLTEGQILRIENISSGSAPSYVITLEGGMQGVFKPTSHVPHANFKNEIAAYLIDQKIGFNLVPQTVYRKIGDLEGSVQFYVSGTQSAEKLGIKVEQDSAKLRLFDYLLDNGDRLKSRHNLLIKDSREIAIDHGIALSGFDLHPKLWPDFPPDLIKKIKSVPESEWYTLLTPWLSRPQIHVLLNQIKSLP